MVEHPRIHQSAHRQRRSVISERLAKNPKSPAMSQGDVRPEMAMAPTRNKGAARLAIPDADDLVAGPRRHASSIARSSLVYPILSNGRQWTRRSMRDVMRKYLSDGGLRLEPKGLEPSTSWPSRDSKSRSRLFSLTRCQCLLHPLCCRSGAFSASIGGNESGRGCRIRPQRDPRPRLRLRPSCCRSLRRSYS